MKIILLSNKHRAPRSMVFNPGLVAAFFCALLVMPAVFGYYMGVHHNWLDSDMLPLNFADLWDEQLAEQTDQMQAALTASEQQFEALTLRVAELQARLVRLDAVGEHLVETSGLNADEFDFSSRPALGGPVDEFPETENMAFKQPEFLAELNKLTDEIERREQKLRILQSMINGQELSEKVFIAGHPVKKGWISSGFGRRTDPFSGRIANHLGVDFAGKEGSEIIAVAAGVVTFSGTKFGYGNLVEISHGSGYFTRYGHCKDLIVQVGDLVKGGDVIATIGSTGRSTGPHVHFEVLKGGKQLDPTRYIARSRN